MKAKKNLPPRLFQMAIILILVVHFIIPTIYLYHSPLRFLGVLPILLGTYMNLLTDRLISENKTTIKPFDNPSLLIEEGPFRFSRNPIYLGMVLIILGGAVISGAALSFAVPLVFAVCLYFMYIKPEEAILERSFGKHYLEYRKRVRCWL